jgi:hypothetical protein
LEGTACTVAGTSEPVTVRLSEHWHAKIVVVVIIIFVVIVH